MKRKVNECGEHAGPLWLCVSLISSDERQFEGEMGPITAMALSGLRVRLFQAACFAVNNTAGKNTVNNT